MSLNVFSLAGLVSFLSTAGLGIFVIARDPRQSINRRFGAFALNLAFWSLFSFAKNVSIAKGQVAFWNGVQEIVTVFIPATYFSFTASLGALTEKNRTRDKLVAFCFLVSTVFMLLSLTPFFSAQAIQRQWVYMARPRLGRHIYDLYFGIVVAVALYDLWGTFKKSSSYLRNQLKYVFLASLIGFGFGLTSILAASGVKIVPLALFGMPVSMAILTYAIVRHRLMDIEVVIRKGLIYSVLTALLAGTYFALLHLTGVQVERLTGLRFIWLTVLAVVALAMIFEPLRRGIQSLVDKLFFKTKYEYQDAIKKFSQMVVTILDLDILLTKTVRTVKEILKIDRALLLLYNPDEKKYKVAAFEGIDESVAQAISFGPRSRFVQNLKRAGSSVVEEVDGGSYSVTAISLFIKNDLIGFLILGEKLSGDIYTREDLELLTTLANQLSIAIENARLYRAAVTDKLTKLFDGVYFYRRLDEELKRSRRHRTPLSLIMLDVDNFTAFSQAKGRTIANRTLVGISQIIQENIRPFDIPARIGEDEFAVILPGVSKGEAAFLGARLRKKIETLKIEEIRGGLSVTTGLANAEDGEKKGKVLVDEARLSLCKTKDKNLKRSSGIS